MSRPLFHAALARFQEVNKPVDDVGSIIGGMVRHNIDGKIFQNACPIRMSYVLNHTGFPVRKELVPLDKDGKLQVSSGGDHLWYIFRVTAMISYLNRVFGDPNIEAKKYPPEAGEFAGHRGILAVQGHGYSDASGHVAVFDGTWCADTCHLAGDPLNRSFVPHKAFLWTLP